MSVRLEGARELADSSRAAADRITDLADPSRKIGARLEALADPPVVTGRLASTVTAVLGPTGVTLTAGGPAAPYALRVHASNPFLLRAVDAGAEEAVTTVTDYVTDVVDSIQGA